MTGLLFREVRAKIRRDKVDWLKHECSLITEANSERQSKKLFQQIRKLKPTVTQVRNQSINNKDGETLTETEDVLDRWTQYGRELFESSEDNSDLPDLTFYVEHEPEPLLDEIKAGIKQLKTGKSPGLDNVPAELLKHSGEGAIMAIHYLCNTIWRTCSWPEDWKTQEFVMLYKSGNVKECNNYRTIALISHASKILLIIILQRMKKKVEEELSDCQAGYRRNRGTIDMLFSLQLMIEKVRNSNYEAFFCIY